MNAKVTLTMSKVPFYETGKNVAIKGRIMAFSQSDTVPWVYL